MAVHKGYFVWENYPKDQCARLLPFSLLKFLFSPFGLRLRLYCGLTTAAKTRIQRSNWHYRTGGNLTIFDKGDDAVEREQPEVLTAKHGRLLQLLCPVGSNLAKLNA